MWTKGTVIIALGVFMCTAAQGQETLLRDGSTIFEGHEGRWVVGLGAHGQHGSNAFHREMADKFLFGGFIDDDIKDQFSANLRNQNSLVLDGALQVSLTFLVDSTWGITASASRNELQRIDFSNDAAELLFRGNTHFADGVVQLSEEGWNRISFEKYQIGAVDTKSGSFAKLGVYRGLALESWRLPTATLTSQDAEVDGLSIPHAITSEVSELEGLRSTGSHNWGVGIDLFGAIHNDLGTFALHVEDLGAMRWSEMDRRDTSGVFSFSGFDLFSDNQSENVLENLIDSISPASRLEENNWRMLPAKLAFTYISPRWNERFFLTAKVFHRFGLQAYPAAQLTGNYAFAEKSFVWASIAHTDFSPLQIGLGLQATVLKHALLSVYTFHLPGYLNQKSLSRSIGLQWIQRI